MQGAVPLLLGIPASEINNQMIDLTSLLGRQGEVLSEKMLTAVDNRQRAAIHQIIHTGGQTPIQSLSEQYFLSSRQFTRTFQEYAGKEFSGHHPRHYFSGNAEGTEWKD